MTIKTGEYLNKEWLKQRQQHLTASDCLFLLKNFTTNTGLKDKLHNVKTYDRTLYQMYMEKEVLTPEQYCIYQESCSNAIMQEGKDREDEIAKKAQEDLHFDYLHANGSNLAISGNAAATPDYYVNFKETFHINKNIKCNLDTVSPTTFKGEGILECKLTANLTDDKFIGYQFQVQYQLLCTGLKWAVIAIAIKESREIGSPIGEHRYHFVNVNKIAFVSINDSILSFYQWLEKIKDGTIEAPKPDFTNKRDNAILKVINTSEIEDEELLADALEFIEVNELYKAKQATSDSLKERIIAKYGNNSQTLVLKNPDGQHIALKQTCIRETYYTEEDKIAAIEKASAIEVGAVKSKSVSKLSVSFVD